MQEERQPVPLLVDIGYLLLKILIIGALAVVMFTFLFGICRNPDASMTPATARRRPDNLLSFEKGLSGWRCSGNQAGERDRTPTNRSAGGGCSGYYRGRIKCQWLYTTGR